MPIRIERGGRWVEFRETGWTFGDRRAILAATDDETALVVVLPYVTSWSLKDVDGAEVAPSGVDKLDRVEDDDVVFVIQAWFEARAKRNTSPKAT